MTERRKSKCEGDNSCCQGLDRLFNQLTEAWFNENFKDWKWFPKRFFLALLGSFSLMIFLSPILVERIFKSLPTIFFDPGLKTITTSLITVLVISVSPFFAFLVSWRNDKSGPMRMYLAGLTLPAFVFFVIDQAVT